MKLVYLFKADLAFVSETNAPELFLLKIEIFQSEAGEMAQWLWILAALAVDLGSIPSIRMVAHVYL